MFRIRIISEPSCSPNHLPTGDSVQSIPDSDHKSVSLAPPTNPHIALQGFPQLEILPFSCYADTMLETVGRKEPLAYHSQAVTPDSWTSEDISFSAKADSCLKHMRFHRKPSRSPKRNPSSSVHLFKYLDPEEEEKATRCKAELQTVLEALEDLIEPVSVKDRRRNKPEVFLLSPTRSKLASRRSSA